MKKFTLLFISIVFHVEITGKGEPIIFIPGFTVPGDIWNPIVEELKNNYECHIVTLAGFGGKAPIAFPWLPKINQSLKNYIVENDLENITINLSRQFKSFKHHFN